jgi:hypothetical protein
MAYDRRHAERMRRALSDYKDLREQPMFGGLCFMLQGHMLCGIGGQGFMFRVGKDQDAPALARPGATAVELGGRRMRGFIWVDPDECPAAVLRRWISMAERHVAALPAKGRRR